jgi:RND family efflux transporter MFP subunit
VLERNVTQGTAVTPGTPLFVVSDLGALWALAEVDERHLGALRVSHAASVRVAAFPDQPFPARVAFVGDTVNPRTRRVMVRCAVANPGGLLKPGMFATVDVQTGEPRRAVEVPAGAVQELEGRRVVFVDQGNGLFAVREVGTGATVDGWVEITRGLLDGEPVASAGTFLIKSELLKSTLSDEG